MTTQLSPTPAKPALGHIQIINGENDPPWPYMVVDGYGMQVDFGHIDQDGVFDQNTVARIVWGNSTPDGHTYGVVTLKNGDQRTFWDAELMWPYLKAYQIQRAKHEAAV